VTHVLIPLDGSALAEAVLPVAVTLDPSLLTLLHVVEPGEAPTAAEDVFRVARERAGLSEERVRTITRPGRPAEAIVGAARDVGATVIALSSHGRTGLNRLVLGSVAEEVVRSASAPVLLVRAGAPAARPVLERPLVGYDGSDLAWRAVEALALVGRARPAQVDLLGVHDVAPFRAAEADPAIERLLARQRDALLQQVERAAERARHLGMSAAAAVREGRPSTVLLETAERGGNTAIAVATHGRTALTRWIFGSVAEELLHASSLPLLIVR
jgi:nucleotide-binding universal stress UspA family protein